MEVKENSNAFKGNSKIGIKTGVQKPKPLKSSTETKLQLQTIRQEELKVEDVQCLFDRIVKHLSDKVHKPEVVSAIITLNASLKVHGGEIEANNKINMDKYQLILREACKNPELDLVARLQLLEIIELRSVKWKPNDDLSNYYKQKLQQIEQENAQEALEIRNTSQLGSKVLLCLKNLPPTTLNVNAPDFVPPPTPKENLSAENKAFPEMKVEIGAHRRRVQIIEPESVRNCSTKNTDKHGHIKPSFASGSPSGDGISCNRLAGDYTYTVPVGNGNYLNIQGNDPELTKAANMVLRDFFGKYSRNNSALEHQSKHLDKEKSVEFRKNGINGINFKYDREALLTWSKSPYSKQLPTKWSAEWEKVKNENPSLFRQIVSRNAKEVNGLCQKNNTKFCNFVQPYYDEDASTHENKSPNTTVLRAQHSGDRKLDDNNNVNKKSLRGKPKRWDDSIEKWVEVDE